MKLNDFFEKSPRPRLTPQKVITVTNEKKENELVETIQTLQKELDRLHTVESERSEFNRRMQAADLQLKETLEREVSLKAAIALFKQNIEEGDSVRTENQTFKEHIKDLKGTLRIQDATLEQSKKNNLELNVLSETLTKQLKDLQVEDDNVRLKLDTSLRQTVTSIDSFNKMTTKLDETDKIFQEIQVKYKEGQRKNSELNKEVNYLTRVSNTLQEERDELEQTRHMLKELASHVEADNVETKGAVRVTQAEMKKLRGTVGIMTTNIDGLIRENKELSSFNSALKNELSRPKYMSMATVDRSEGFKLPTGGYRKHFLGNSKPTLLKFKREDSHDN